VARTNPRGTGIYAMTKGKIVLRMAPVRFVSLEEFHSRKLCPSESLSVFVHELKQLLGQAILDANTDTSKQLLLSGLPSSINKQLRAANQINDLDTALEQAKLLMTLEGPESTAAIQTTEVEVLEEQISLLTE